MYRSKTNYSVIHIIAVCFALMITVPSYFSYRSHDEKNDWIGKAYIITSKVQVSDDVTSAAKACGFSPYILPATLPFGHHYSYSKEKLYKTCLGIQGLKLLPYGESTYAAQTTLSELALICSHRNAMHMIAQDLTMSDTDWALIMEDDAVLNTALNPNLARSYTTQAINFARWESVDKGFIYFGICHGVCSKSVSIFLAADQFSVGKSCFGYCTHAYALTKHTARTFFAKIYNNEVLKENLLQTDQVMAAYFQANLKSGSSPAALVAGYNFQSPYEPNHTGFMYQTNRSRSINGTLLGTALTASKFRHQTCFIMRSDGTSVTMLLFQYAALVSFCIRRNLMPQYCASFVSRGKKSAAFNLFTQEFRIDPVKCVANNQTIKDVDIVDRINAESRYSPSNFISVAAFGTSFHGSFAKLKLIQETARWLKQYFQSVFQPSPYIRSSSRSSSSSSVIDKEYPSTAVLSWLTGSTEIPEQIVSLTPCSQAAVDVCIHVSGATKEKDFSESDQALLQKFYASALNRFSLKYVRGIALHLILDSSVHATHLQGILSLSSRNASCIYVKSLKKFKNETNNFQADLFNNYMHQDIWTIRALMDCNKIVLGHNSLASRWGAYLSSAEVITSSQVQNPLPGWTVI